MKTTSFSSSYDSCFVSVSFYAHFDEDVNVYLQQCSLAEY